MSQPVIIIVGAGPGVGSAAARRFAADGYEIGLVARSEDRLARLAGELEADGAKVGWIAADMADDASLGAGLSQMIEHTGRVDVLLHNASVYREVAPRDLDAAGLLADLAVGTASLLTMVGAALPALLAQRTGTILATGGGAADNPSPVAASLGVQKAALRMLVQLLAADLASDGIHVATVTVHGFIKDDSPFAPERIADLYAELVAETSARPDRWRSVVDLRN